MRHPMSAEEWEAYRRATEAIDTFRANMAELAQRMRAAAEAMRRLFEPEREPWEQDPDAWKGEPHGE